MDKTNVVSTKTYECDAPTASQLMAQLALWLNCYQNEISIFAIHTYENAALNLWCGTITYQG